ncbi:MAG: substrate-binding domain-containing protein, partial [Devosia sp.]
MKRRNFLMSVAVGAMAIAMASPGALGAGKALTIMAGVGGLEFPFFVVMMDKFKAAAEAIGGITLLVSDGQNSATKQTADIEAAIVQKVDAIVFSPLDVDALV